MLHTDMYTDDPIRCLRLGPLGLCGRGLPAPQDGVREAPAELVQGAEDPGVRQAHQGEELLQTSKIKALKA